MARKFKHKQTGWVAIKGTATKYDIYVNSSNVDSLKGSVHADLIENSNDWVEITTKEPGLLLGRWYSDFDEGWFRATQVTEDGKVLGDNYVHDDLIEVEESYCCTISEIKRGLNHEEIHQALEAIRKHKGFVEGIKIKWEGQSAVITGGSIYYHDTDSLYVDVKKGFLLIFCNGKWAEKVEEPILTTQDGHKIEMNDAELWLADLAEFEIWPIDVDEAIESQYYVFAYYSNAKRYIEHNKPKFSDFDLHYIEKEVKNVLHSYHTISQIEDGIMTAITYLKESKRTN